MSKQLAILVLICAMSLPVWADVTASTMPTLPVESLSARQFAVPADLPNLPLLFIVGFSKASRSQTMEWSRLVEDRFPRGSVAIHSVSVMEDVPRLLRGWVVNSIRSGVPEELHDRFLVVSKHAAVWKALASYAEPDAAYLVLTNHNHEVVWRTGGPATEAGVQVLVEQVRASSQ